MGFMEASPHKSGQSQTEKRRIQKSDRAAGLGSNSNCLGKFCYRLYITFQVILPSLDRNFRSFCKFVCGNTPRRTKKKYIPSRSQVESSV